MFVNNCIYLANDASLSQQWNGLVAYKW